jgi:RHS repeat-associated protein
VYFYGVDGQQLGAYAGGSCTLESSTYFGSKRVAYGGSDLCGVEYTDPVPGGTAWEADRLGSYGTYYPWGETKGSTNPADIWSFATYWRDSFTGLDYANQRYYSNVIGRFMTPDPYRGSAHPGDPQSWNRYTYALGDPVNHNDPSGLDCTIDDEGDDGGGGGGGDDCPPSGGGGSPGGYCDDPPCVGADGFEPGPFCPAAGGPPDGGGGGGTPPPPHVTSLDITLDCWQLHNQKLLGAPSRDTQFTAFQGTASLAGQNIVITESVTTSPGGSLATNLIGDPNSSEAGGVFDDQKGLAAWQPTGTYTLYQSFTVSMNGGPAVAVPILIGGQLVPYITETLSSSYGTIRNWLRGVKNYDVAINGKGKSTIPLCNNTGQ